MTEVFNYLKTIIDIIKGTISSITDFIPSITNFFLSGIDILPNALKVPLLVVLSISSAILIYRFIR